MSHRLHHLDGLRGIAASLVLTEHLLEYFCSLAPPGNVLATGIHGFVMAFLNLGKVGVVAFFAISGFIVPYSFQTARPRFAFLVSRFFRLYPAYWISLVAAAMFLPWVKPVTFGAAQVVANLSMVQMLLGQKDVLAVYWTLFIEILFYASCFAAFSLGFLRSPRHIGLAFLLMLALGIVGSVLRTNGHHTLPAAIPLYLAIMWWSTCLRLAILEHDVQARRLAWWMLGALVIAIPLVWCIAYDDSTHKSSRLADIQGFYVGIGLFLVCVYRRAFAVRPLVYAGAISYSIYLFHQLTLEVGRLAAVRFTWPVSGAVLLLTVPATTLMVAHLVYTFAEKPSIRFGKRLLITGSGKPTPSTPPLAEGGRALSGSQLP